MHVALRRLQPALIHPGPERLMLGGQVADPGGSFSELALWGWGQRLAFAVADRASDLWS